MPAYITLGNDSNRIVRSIYLSSKLGFELDDEIVEWIKSYPEKFGESKSSYIIKKLKEAFYYNPQNTEKLINNLNLWKYVPPDKNLLPYIAKNIRKI